MGATRRCPECLCLSHDGQCQMAVYDRDGNERPCQCEAT